MSRCPGVRHREALGLWEPRLDEFASFDEPRHTVGSEHIEHWLGDASGLAVPKLQPCTAVISDWKNRSASPSALSKASGITGSSAAR